MLNSTFEGKRLFISFSEEISVLVAADTRAMWR